jgi:hypothetical protein
MSSSRPTPFHSDPVIFHQLPLIARIIQDETWLEGERRGCPVSTDDPVVREKVCTVVLRIGADMRIRLTSPWSGQIDAREHA